jgi:AcrR family transcriptional regulator
VVPATLVQRFGSKRGLLLTLAREGSTTAAHELAAIRAAQPSPMAALRALVDCMAGMAPSPEALANHLAMLNMDLTDPEFHRYALAGAQAFQNELQALLEAAVTVGQLAPCDTARLARLIQEVLHGALVAWAIYREGTAKDWLRQDLEMLLAPHTARQGQGKRRRTRRRGNIR